MIKIYLYTIVICIPSLGQADNLKEFSSPPRLNLEVNSTNTCSTKPNISPRRGNLDNQRSYVFKRDFCFATSQPTWRENQIFNNEVNTWVATKSGYWGIGLRFELGEGTAQFRIRSNGGFQIRYKTTFNL